MGKKRGRRILLTRHLFHDCKVLLHAVNLRHGTDGFTSPPKEVVLRIFITFKNPSSSAGFEPANLGSSVASTLTTRPPRATHKCHSKKHAAPGSVHVRFSACRSNLMSCRLSVSLPTRSCCSHFAIVALFFSTC
jgi:hypothetical protein